MQPPMQPPPMGPPGAPAAAKPADPAKNAGIMLAVASGLMLIALFSKNWSSAGAGDRKLHIGPLGAERCEGSFCVDMPLKGMPGDVELIMMLAMISGFASVGLAGWFGAATLAGKPVRYRKMIQINVTRE